MFDVILSTGVMATAAFKHGQIGRSYSKLRHGDPLPFRAYPNHPLTDEVWRGISRVPWAPIGYRTSIISYTALTGNTPMFFLVEQPCPVIILSGNVSPFGATVSDS